MVAAADRLSDAHVWRVVSDEQQHRGTIHLYAVLMSLGLPLP